MDYSRIRNAIDRNIYLGTTTGKYVCTIDGNGFYTIRLQKSGLFIEADIFGKEIYTIRSTGDAGTFKLKVVSNKLYIDSTGFEVYVYYTTDRVTNGTGSYDFNNDDKTYTVGEIYYLKSTTFSNETNEVSANKVTVNTFEVNSIKLTGTTNVSTPSNATVNIDVKTLRINNAELNGTKFSNLYATNIDTNNIKIGNWTISKDGDSSTITITIS